MKLKLQKTELQVMRSANMKNMCRKDVDIMRERKIKMTPAEVQNFVNEASKCDFDIDISYNHYTVDAKSILGVMGLDFRSILTLQYAGYNDEFESYVSRFAVA